MNGHAADEEIKRQRLHYSSDQLYSVSLIHFEMIDFFRCIIWIDVKADVADQVEHQSKGRQALARHRDGWSFAHRWQQR